MVKERYKEGSQGILMGDILKEGIGEGIVVDILMVGSLVEGTGVDIGVEILVGENVADIKEDIEVEILTVGIVVDILRAENPYSAIPSDYTPTLA